MGSKGAGRARALTGTKSRFLVGTRAHTEFCSRDRCPITKPPTVKLSDNFARCSLATVRRASASSGARCGGWSRRGALRRMRQAFDEALESGRTARSPLLDEELRRGVGDAHEVSINVCQSSLAHSLELRHYARRCTSGDINGVAASSCARRSPGVAETGLG